MGNVEKKLTMRAMFGWLLFISYPFCGHAGILKVSLSFLPLCTVFWATKTYLTDSYFSSRPLKKWLHSGWYRTVLTLFIRRKRNIPTCVTFFSPPLLGWAEYRFIPGKSYCFVYWPSDVYYMYFMITVCFFGPLSIMTFSYCNVLRFTKNLKRRIAATRNNFVRPVPTIPNKVDLSLKCLSIPFLTLKLVFKYRVSRHLFCRRISDRACIL